MTWLARNVPPTIYMAVGLMAILVMMILPVPPMVLDFGLMLSFAFAILIFTVVLFVERPLDFSSFPAILLVSLLLRLSLNISSTKLIIGEGHTGPDAAGGVIEGFAMFIMGGSLGMGLIVFSVLIIVNFLVITKGAGRMAEVGARFALDAMPGKQLAIDSDVAAGAITHDQARVLRAREQEETAFLGSLDGVSKFVKGDAIAGLLITLLNIVAGIAIGLIVHKIPFAQALQNYSILTVGDGLVSQIPAVIISVSAALLLSKGRSEGAVDLALFREMGHNPEALGTVAAVLLVFAAFPGLPILPFIAGSSVLGGLAWRAFKARRERNAAEAATPDLSEEPSKDVRFGDLLDMDDVHIELAPDIVRGVIEGDGSFDQRVEKIRRFVIQEFGFIMPPVRVTDRHSLAAGNYEIKIHGVPIATNTLRIGKYLALIGHEDHPDISGEEVQEPVYGASARWVDEAGKKELVLAGATVVDPVEVLSTHLLETTQAEFSRLLTRRTLKEILESYSQTTDETRAEANKRLIDDFVPERVPYDILQQVLRDLLSERVSVRNLPIVLEAISEARGQNEAIDSITEHVRRRLSFQFVRKLCTESKNLPVIEVSTLWAKLFAEAGSEATPEEEGAVAEVQGQEVLSLNSFVRKVRGCLDAAAGQGQFPVIATHASMRRAVKRALASHGVTNPVLSFDEISTNATPNILATT